MYNILPLAFGSKSVMCLPFASLVVYMKQLTKQWFLKEKQLGLCFDHYCLQRLLPTLDDSHLIEYKDKLLEPIARLLFFDKVAVCMSALIDATAELIIHNNWGTNLQKIVKIVTPIGWVHGLGAQWQCNSCLYLGVQRNNQWVEQQEVSMFNSFCQLEPLC